MSRFLRLLSNCSLIYCFFFLLWCDRCLFPEDLCTIDAVFSHLKKDLHMKRSFSEDPNAARHIIRGLMTKISQLHKILSKQASFRTLLVLLKNLERSPG